jgi:hypothetical protein
MNETLVILQEEAADEIERLQNKPKPYDHTQWSIDNFGSPDGA